MMKSTKPSLKNKERRNSIEKPQSGKSYHPLKMWGSYLGLGIGLIGSYFSFALVLDAAEKGIFTVPVLFIPVAPAVVGFILGWLVHSFLRKVSTDLF